MTWPAPVAGTTTLHNVAASRLVTIVQPAPTLTATPISTATPTVAPQPTAVPCLGDCNGDHTVTVDELVTLVDVALEAIPERRCLTDDRSVTVDLIIEAVGNALRGCPSDSGAE